MMAGGFSPAGLSVLIVDGDSSCLKNLETILNKYHYQVKTSTSAKEAAEMLKNERFEMVISDVNMSDINDGFLFIRHVAFNTKIPIILMSNDEETNKVMRGLQCGACVYLLKPIQPKDVQFIWQHVYRKSIYQIEGGKEDSRHTTEIGMDGSIAKNKRGGESGGDSSSHVKISPKKPRLVWNEERKKLFEKAVEIGGPKIGPKKILELMGDKSFTREQIASHLQKHRINLTKDADKEAATNIHLQQQPPVNGGQNFQIQNQDFQIQNQVASPINQNIQIQNQDSQIQNQVARRINHYQGGQNLQIQNQDFQIQNPVTSPINQNIQIQNQDFQIQNQVARRINHYQGGQNFQIQNQVASPINQSIQIQKQEFQIQNQVARRINHYQGGQNFQIQNQVASRINHYQRLNQCGQNLCESNDGYSFDQPFNSGNSQVQSESNQPFNYRNSQVQSESRMPQPAHNYSVHSEERFHFPLRLMGFPDAPEHIPHATMRRTNNDNEQNVGSSDVVDPRNSFTGHSIFDDVPEPVSNTSMLRNMDEQNNVDIDFYHQNQISSLPEDFGYGDPNTCIGFAPEQNVHEECDPSFSIDDLFYPGGSDPNGGRDPNDGGSDPTHTYPKNDSDS